jgi:SAM-dependent methyltransferase
MLDLFRCPLCGSSLHVCETPSGDVECEHGHVFPTDHGYLDLSGHGAIDETTSRTFESFGYEWNAFDDVRDEDAEFARVYFRDIDLSELAGKTGLDAGCGKGRYTRFLAPNLGRLVALDGSSAVEAAAKNLGKFTTVMVVKADLRTAPVVEGSMDFISCLGVLHHLKDPRAGFTRLVDLLAPGGTMLLYLYSRPTSLGLRGTALMLAGVLRRLTVKMPHRILRGFSAVVAGLLFLGVVQPGAMGARMRIGPLARLPMSAYRGKPFRSLELDTFDRLSAPVEHRYTWADLAPWFADAGMSVEAAREETGWFVVARKPSTV